MSKRNETRNETPDLSQRRALAHEASVINQGPRAPENFGARFIRLGLIIIALVIACAALIVSFPEGRQSACQATPGGIFRTLNCGEAK